MELSWNAARKGSRRPGPFVKTCMGGEQAPAAGLVVGRRAGGAPAARLGWAASKLEPPGLP